MHNDNKCIGLCYTLIKVSYKIQQGALAQNYLLVQKIHMP